MKILYVTTISNTINAFLVPHIELLIDSGYQVDIACNIEQPLDEKLVNLGCNIFNIKFSRSPISKSNLSAYGHLKQIIERHQYNLIHTHTPVASTCVRIACRKKEEVKVFYTAHGFHFYKGASFLNWNFYYPIEKWLARYTDCLITINKEDYKNAIDLNFKSKNIKLVSGVGIDTRNFVAPTKKEKIELRKEYGYNQDDFIIICVGEINKNKHQDLLIKAVSLSYKKISKLKVLLVGKGNLESNLRELSGQLGLENLIEFLGYRSDVAKLMQIADVGVSTSYREGLPVNVMEEMATGLPLIVTDCRGSRDLVIPERNGYIVGVEEEESLSQYIEKLFTNFQLREQFSVNNLKDIQKYDVINVMEEMKDIYSEYLNIY